MTTETTVSLQVEQWRLVDSHRGQIVLLKLGLFLLDDAAVAL